MKVPENILSHDDSPPSLEDAVSNIKSRIESQGDKEHVSKAEQLKLLDELLQFELGRFLILNRGVNGFWTHYVCTYLDKGKVSGQSSDGSPLTSLEKFYLEYRPMGRATQERFKHFLALGQKELKNGSKFCSVACGMMGELLYLNYSSIDKFDLVGIDLDQISLDQARSFAQELKLEKFCRFLKCDAWKLPFKQEFDLITSSGLNIYESEPAKLISLYRGFYEALKPNGLSVTSFVTVPPWVSKSSEWNMAEIDEDAMRLQRIIHSDILEFKAQAFCTSATMRSYLESAGFREIQIIWDNARVFPTVTARR